MVEIVVTEEQATTLRQATDDVLLRSPDGDVLGLVATGIVIRSPADEEAFVRQSIARAAASRNVRIGVTSQELLGRLSKLDHPE